MPRFRHPADPDIIATEIAEDLRADLEQFDAIAAESRRLTDTTLFKRSSDSL